MSQNRQSAKDRLEAEIDHSINVHAELAIRQLSDRLDAIDRSLSIIEQQAFVADCRGDEAKSKKQLTEKEMKSCLHAESSFTYWHDSRHCVS